MKTAVEYIKEKLMCDEYWYENMTFDQIFEQAKEMEKEQIVKHSVELTKILISNPFETSGKHPKELVDNYFNETFKQHNNENRNHTLRQQSQL
jgi:hypothetical protein